MSNNINLYLFVKWPGGEKIFFIPAPNRTIPLSQVYLWTLSAISADNNLHKMDFIAVEGFHLCNNIYKTFRKVIGIPKNYSQLFKFFQSSD